LETCQVFFAGSHAPARGNEKNHFGEINPMKQVAPLRYDVIFKKAFSHINIFTALVKDFLGIELEIDEVENDKAFVPPVGNVATKFDLFAELPA
jgi:hypothetical protein